MSITEHLITPISSLSIATWARSTPVHIHTVHIPFPVTKIHLITPNYFSLLTNPEWAWECRHHAKTSCAYYSCIMYVVYKFTIPWHPTISTVIRFIHQHTYDIAARIPYIRSTCSPLTIDHFRIRDKEPLTSHTCIEILCQVAHFVVITQLHAIL